MKIQYKTTSVEEREHLITKLFDVGYINGYLNGGVNALLNDIDEYNDWVRYPYVTIQNNKVDLTTSCTSNLRTVLSLYEFYNLTGIKIDFMFKHIKQHTL